MIFIPFPEISGFHNVVKAFNAYPHIAGNGIVTYRGKIKLHGSNGAVRVCNNQVAAQSRSRIITTEDDNAGFAKWVEVRKDFFSKITGEENTVFGEWCGPGIMKATAIQQIPNKIFAIFAFMRGIMDDDTHKSEMITEPSEIANILGDLPEDVKILPWDGEAFIVDFTKREELQKKADEINNYIQQIEPCDPWVKSTFGVDGVCEGVVYVPTGKITRKQYSDLAFKAKGEKHKVVKTKQAVQIDPEVAANVDEFIKLFCTEARFDQGLNAIGGNFDIKLTGQFLKWIGQDVLKESTDELEASNLEWDDVQSEVQKASRIWFMTKCKVI